MTNYEKIQQMNPEELAEFLAPHINDKIEDELCKECDMKKMCDKYNLPCYLESDKMNVLKWLCTERKEITLI